MRLIKCFIFFVFVCSSINGQNSFSVECQVGDNFDEIGIDVSKISGGILGEAYLVAARNGLTIPSIDNEELEVILLSIDEFGSSKEAFAVGANFIGEISLIVDYQTEGTKHAFQIRASSGMPDIREGYLFVIDFEEGAFWCRQSNKRELYLTPLCISGNNVYYYQNDTFPPNYPYPNFLGINRAAVEDGEIFWSKKYFISSLSYDVIRSFSIDSGENETISIGGVASSSSSSNEIVFIIQLDSDGSVINSVSLTTGTEYRPYGQVFDDEGNLILWGRCFGSNFEGLGFVMKLDPEMNVIWGKVISLDFFIYNDLKIEVFPDNSLLFSFSTFGDFPVVVGRISPEGNLLSHGGYALHNPAVFVGEDYSVTMTSSSKTLPDGTKEPGLVIVKADSLGNVAGCPSFDACVELIDFEVETFPLEWTVEDTDPLPMYEVEVEEFDFSTSPYCVTPPPPTPTFTFPDTLCAGACASPDSMNNRLAHQAQWYVQGPGLDTLIADTTFALCFIEPGEYLIEQEVWLLGCSEIEQHTLTVLPPLQTSFNRTDTICGELPVSLSVQSDRVLRNWNWSTGATIPSLPIAQSGTYAVTVSDGYCADTLSAELTLVAELAEEAVVQLPPEQTICATELPYLLQPFSPYTTNFTLLNNGQEGTVFALTEPGTYTVQAEYLGCPFTSTFRLQTSTCANTLYWPNVFSPNADGINDRWAPQSPEHDLTLLQIYDRWGGLVYESRAADAYWDGRGRDGQPATAGVYVGLVRYRHRVSGEEGMEQGEVLLMR
jgi:gliding motility-associated-like protein